MDYPLRLICQDCHLEKDSKYFRTDKRGYKRYCCNDCEKVQRRKYYNQDKETGLHREKHLQRTFGISLKDYQFKFDEQNGLCAICHQPEVSNRILSVDHNHKTNQIRSLLCTSCNVTLGRIKEDELILQSMIDYIKQWKH